MAPFRLLGLIAAVVLSLAASLRPGIAMVIYPWCVQYGGISSSTLSCGFTSFRQCLATASGNRASCIPNPWYSPYPPPVNYAPPLRR